MLELGNALGCQRNGKVGGGNANWRCGNRECGDGNAKE